MKKIIIIATVILIAVLILLLIISSGKKLSGLKIVNSPTPTLVPLNIVGKNTLNAAKDVADFETPDFNYSYSQSLNKVVVEKKTAQAQDKFNQWAVENGLSALVSNPNLVSYVSLTTTPGAQNVTPSISITPYELRDPGTVFLNIVDVLTKLGSGITNSTSKPITSDQSSGSNKGKNSNYSSEKVQFDESGRVYYGQCSGGYSSIPLPSGCDLCHAGCGPSTVAMIASSYLGSDFNPQKIVDIYKSKGYYLGCDGSSYADAKSALEDLGLKTTSYLSYGLGTADQVAPDFKKYLDGGWTIFTLASYCDGGCGHYFWVTGVNGNNIYAYDPYYGQGQSPPINENSRYPFPKYRIAFGVKK